MPLIRWEEPGSFRFGGISLNTVHAVNDVKKFQVDGQNWYLMALHKKGDVGLTVKDADKLWLSLSKDGKTFGEEQNMVRAREEIWLQKRVVLTEKPGYSEGNGAEYEARGPDRQHVKLPLGQTFEGTLTLYGEDGSTPIATVPVSLKPGCIYLSTEISGVTCPPDSVTA